MQLRALAVAIGLCVSCGDNIHDTSSSLPTPARVVTSVTPNPVTAGDTLTVTCKVLDENGGVLSSYSPTVEINPVDPGTVVTDLSAVVKKAGHYAAQCRIPEIAGDNVGFDVIHALPAQIMISKVPDQMVYGIGVPVQLAHAVADKYGNPIDDATVVNTSTALIGTGPIVQQAADTFMYMGEGKYGLHAQVMPPTADGADVSADVDLVINQSGPKITCGTPTDGTMLNLAPGTTVTVNGSAVDTNGTMSVVVNGNPVTADVNGNFSTTVTTRFGINFVDIKATDDYGVDTAKVCTFLVANQYAGTNGMYNDTISLKLTQAAIDDGNRGGAINSLGDMLNTVANSPGLHAALDSSLSAAPLHPNTCDQDVCLFGNCVCILRDEVDYKSSSLPGPNLDSLALVNGGLAVTETILNPSITLRVFGQVSGIPYDTTGPVTFSQIQVTAIFDLSLAGGHPHMAIRPGSVGVTVGSISTDFNGVDGWIIDHILVPIAQGTLRNTVASLVQGYIANNFNAVLDGVVSNLDISTLGTSFDVPRLDGGTIALAFAPAFTTLSTTNARALFGIGTQFSAPVGNMYPTLGAPIPTGAVLTDPVLSTSTGVGAHVAILNQALHTLWKANFFHATLDASSLGGFTFPSAPDDAPPTTIAIDARLPPVANIGNGVVSLDLGDVDLTISNGVQSTSVSVGIRAHTNVALVGNDLSFSGIVIDELHLSSDQVDLSAMQQANLQTLITNLAQELIDTSLNSSLPSLPIPSFTLPASLAAYGLPVGSSLGIIAPSLTLAPPHFMLRGNFGIQ